MQYIKYLSVTAVMLLIGAQFLSAQEREWEVGDTVIAKTLLKEALNLNYEKKFDRAIEKAELSLEIYSAIFGAESIEAGDVLYQLWYSNYLLGNFDRAEQSAQRALEIRRKEIGEKNLKTASSFESLGIVYRSKFKYQEAIDCQLQALKIRESILDKNDFALAKSHGNIGNTYVEIADYDKALWHFQKNLDITKENFPDGHPMLAKSYLGLGNTFNKTGQNDKAVFSFLEVIKILNSSERIDSASLGTAYNNLGNAFLGKGDLNSAINKHKLGLKIRSSSLPENHPDIAWSHNNIANAYRQKGMYELALAHHSKALSIRLESLGENHPAVAASYNSIGNVYGNMKILDMAIKFHQKAVETQIKVTGESHHTVAILLNNLGATFSQIENYDEAINCHNKALEIQKSAIDGQHFEIGLTLFNLGIAYEGKGDYRTSIGYLQEAVELFKNNLGTYHPNTTLSILNIGKAYKKQFFLDEAITAYSSALTSCNYFESDLTDVPSVIYIIEVLNDLSYVYLKKYEATLSPKYLDNSRYYSDETIKAIEFLMSDIRGYNNRVFWQKQAHPIFERTITVKHAQFIKSEDQENIEGIFEVFEKSKGVFLREQLKNSNALKFSGIPDSLLQREYDLRIDMTYLDKKRRALLQKDYEAIDTTVLSLSNQIFDLEQELEALKKQFEEAYPAYHRLKYDRSTISISEVQQELLKPDQALLEYFVGDSSIFIFLIPKEGAPILKEVKKDFPLEDWVAKFREGVSNTNKVKTYLKYAQLLYDSLIQPVAEQLPERVIIVPDGVLGYLPFSALLSGQPGNIGNPKTYPFLLKEHQFSYSYSATLLKEMRDKEHRHQAEGQLLAFAPFFESEIAGITEQRSDAWKKLPFTGPEVKRVASFFPKKYLIFSGKKATKEAFLQDAAHYRFLHIATHGQADDRVGDYSFLVFASPTDTSTAARLFVRELYNLELNADMVVLSACQVGAGQLQRGEGIISLARAFAYAGAKSLVFPIWSVNDGKTAELMGYFYEYLAEGAPKDEALRSAQLKYLDQQPSNFAKHPAFWAAFSAVGDMRAINQ